MVLPELALVIGALSRLGGLLGVLVGAKGEVAENKPDLVSVGLFELVERFITETLAVRSLVVAELYDRHLGVCRTPRRGVIDADRHRWERRRRCRARRLS